MIDKIIKGAKTASEAIGSDAGAPIGNVAETNAGAAGTEVDNLVKGIKSIVDVVKRLEMVMIQKQKSQKKR